jgi:F-type H+-transporting ATPase subunit b
LFASHALLAADSGGTKLILPASNELIWGTVAFLLLLLVLWRAGVFTRIRETLAERTARIQGNLEAAEQERDEARALLGQYREQLTAAKEESNRIIDEARKRAEEIRKDLQGKAEAESNRILSRAQEEIQAERDRAVAAVRSEVGNLAVDLAGRMIGDSLVRDRQLGLVDRYIEDLTETASGSNANGGER